MATEKRLIDAEHLRRYALYEYMKAKMKHKDDYNFEHFAGIVVMMIEELLQGMPTVDAVEVVRCRDCKWYDRNEDFMPQSGSCEFHEMVKMDWDFCSRAKMDGDGNG